MVSARIAPISTRKQVENRPKTSVYLNAPNFHLVNDVDLTFGDSSCVPIYVHSPKYKVDMTDSSPGWPTKVSHYRVIF